LSTTSRRLDTLVWLLLYGGLFAIAVGIALRRTASGGTIVIVLGAFAVVAGAVLLWMRSRLPEPPAS